VSAVRWSTRSERRVARQHCGVLNSTAPFPAEPYSQSEVSVTSLVFRPPPDYPSGPVRAVALPLPGSGVPALSAERWQSWIAKGLVHDRLVRRRFQIVVGIIAVAGIAGALLWF